MVSPLSPSPSLWPFFGHSVIAIYLSFIVTPKIAHKDVRWGYTSTEWIRKVTSLDQLVMHPQTHFILLVVVSHCWVRMGLNIRKNKIWLVETSKFIRVLVYGDWDTAEPSGTQVLTNYVFENFFLFLFLQNCFLPFETEQKAFKHAYRKPNYFITLTWWFLCKRK